MDSDFNQSSSLLLNLDWNSTTPEETPELDSTNSVTQLNDDTLMSLEKTAKKFKRIEIGHLRTTSRLKASRFSDVHQLTISPGAVSWNIKTILPICHAVETLNLTNVDKYDTEALQVILGIDHGINKNTMWSNVCHLRLHFGQFCSQQPEVMKMLAQKKMFPKLRNFYCCAGLLVGVKLNHFYDLYVGIYQFIAKHRKTLRVLEIIFNERSSSEFKDQMHLRKGLNTFITTNRMHVGSVQYNKLLSNLSLLQLEKLSLTFYAAENYAPPDNPQTQWLLGGAVLNSVTGVKDADINWSNNSEWTTYHLDLELFTRHNADTLEILTVAPFSPDHKNFNSLAMKLSLQHCSLLNELNISINAPFCHIRNMDHLPQCIKHLGLFARILPGQLKWIENNLKDLEVFTFSVQPFIPRNIRRSSRRNIAQLIVLPLFRLEKLRQLSLYDCSAHKRDQLMYYCSNHPGLEIQVREPDEDWCHIYIDRSKYHHQLSFESIETSSVTP